MRELGDDVTHGQTYRQTQPFIVKDVSDGLGFQTLRLLLPFMALRNPDSQPMMIRNI